MDNNRFKPGQKTSFIKQINEVKGKETKKVNLTYEQGLDAVRNYIQDKARAIEMAKLNEEVIKDKNYLEERRRKYRPLISDAYGSLSLRIDETTDDGLGRRPLTKEEFEKKALADIVGYGALEEAFSDPRVSDIFVIDYNLIFVERNGENELYEHNFRNREHYEDTLQRFMNESGKEINDGDKKIVNFELYQDRGCATSSRVSPRCPSVTFRKHGYSHVSKQDLVDRQVMTEDMAEMMGTFLRGELNIIYAGLTGSGKTTSIKALVDHYVDDKRILVVEDTQELFLENANTLELVSVKGKTDDETVELYDLILTALRLKPRTILVGEVRGREALAAVEAMETGHSTIFTMHGGEPVNVLNRLVTKYLMAMPSLGIEVVERIIGSAVDYICIQDAIPGIGRKLTTICETSYNFDTRRIDLKPICEFNFETNDFDWISPISKDKAKTMLRRGIKYEEISRWTSFSS